MRGEGRCGLRQRYCNRLPVSTTIEERGDIPFARPESPEVASAVAPHGDVRQWDLRGCHGGQDLVLGVVADVGAGAETTAATTAVAALRLWTVCVGETLGHRRLVRQAGPHVAWKSSNNGPIITTAANGLEQQHKGICHLSIRMDCSSARLCQGLIPVTSQQKDGCLNCSSQVHIITSVVATTYKFINKDELLMATP